MIFFSIREFFYKLNTIGFILLLLPLIVFVYLYLHAIETDPTIMEEGDRTMLLVLFIFVLLIDLTIVHLLWILRIKKLKGFLELSKKMDGYFVLVLVRSVAYSLACLMMGIGFFLTESIYFTGLFILIILLLMLQWPSAFKFSNQLDLRGSERDMVLNNRDLVRRGAKR